MYSISRLYHIQSKQCSASFMKNCFSLQCFSNSSYSKIQNGNLNILTSSLRSKELHRTCQKLNEWNPCCNLYHLSTRNYGIQKVITPLNSKRQVLKRKIIGDLEAQHRILYDVYAYSTSEEINLQNLAADLTEQGLYKKVKLPADADALQFDSKFHVDDERSEIYFMREGSVIFWNMPDEIERNAVLRIVKPHQIDSYEDHLILQEFEYMNYNFTSKSTDLEGGVLKLYKPEDECDDSSANLQLQKYTFSKSISLSVKLALWEVSLQRYVDSVEWVLNDLREGKKLKVSRDFMLRKIGELYTLRHLINLSSDLLDVPDFYWERENLEPLYNKTCNHFNIKKRTNVMNEKITHCCELADLILSELNDKHHTRLEWFIIILILVEVIFEIVHTLERYIK